MVVKRNLTRYSNKQPGIITRSKDKWYEYGEQPSKLLLYLKIKLVLICQIRNILSTEEVSDGKESNVIKNFKTSIFFTKKK